MKNGADRPSMQAPSARQPALGKEALDLPAIAVSERINGPFVQPEGAVLPEFDAGRDDPVPGPVRWARNGAGAETRRIPHHFPFQL